MKASFCVAAIKIANDLQNSSGLNFSSSFSLPIIAGMEKKFEPVSAEEMLSFSTTEIDEIKTASGIQEAAFRHLCMPLLVNFANYVQSFPLNDIEYNVPYGAWKCGLTTSVVAFHYSQSQMFFTNVNTEERRILEPQCQFAAFAATLATVVAILNQNIKIESIPNNTEYHALVSPRPLFSWLQANKNLSVSWRKSKHPLSAAESAAIAAKFIPNGLLNDFDIRVSMMLFGAINPQQSSNGIETTLAKVVRLSYSKVIEAFLENDSKRLKSQANSDNLIPIVSRNISEGLIQAEDKTTPVNPLDSGDDNSQKLHPVSSHSDAGNDGEVSAEFFMDKACKPLKEWFIALTQHDNYSKLKEQLVVSDKGIEIPVSILSSFGLPGPAVKKYMDDAGMVVGRTPGGRSLILSIGLKSVFFGSE